MKKTIKIALAGNPNSGKTTLFNALTGSNQYIGNWPGVTVEKKEGKLKKHDDVVIMDLPGIYSLSPYTPEELVSRNYLIGERPDAILNIVDGTNLERNLYLTTQLTELGIPVVVAVNMMDVVRKTGDEIKIEELSRELGCKVYEISALKGEGVMEAAKAAIVAAESTKTVPMHTFSGVVEHALAHIEEAALHTLPPEQQRWFAIKIFERDQEVLKQLNIKDELLAHIEEDIKVAEKELDDDAESIITNERYVYISGIMKSCCKKAKVGALTTSDRIDQIVTNRFLALPIFVLVMWLVYYISVSTVGTYATDWANEGVFGDGWHLFGIGGAKHEAAQVEYAKEHVWTAELREVVEKATEKGVVGADKIEDAIKEESYGDFEEAYKTYEPSLAKEGFEIKALVAEKMEEAPAAEDFGIWVPGIPKLVEKVLDSLDPADWLRSLIMDGIIAGVGAVLGFVPQMLVLFLFLAFLEGCGYMARVAFIMDRIFRRFGLSGKSFIPMLISSGCGVPGIMASRTIENDRDRRMTIMTTTFIPCSAKLPIIGLISAALFGNSSWVATSAYFLGVGAIVVSGIMLKKTGTFAGIPAPFVMELPAYHWPTVESILRSMWERSFSFIKKAGTIILLASIVIWAGSRFGNTGEAFGFAAEMELEDSILGMIGSAVGWIFAPLGFGGIKATIATIMGLVAKEEVVGVFGVLDFEEMSQIAAYSFLAFNLLCAPCFAAMGAIRREMNSPKWTIYAIGYQTVFAYAVSLIIFQIGSAFMGKMNIIGLVAAVLVVGFLAYMVLRPERKMNKSK